MEHLYFRQLQKLLNILICILVAQGVNAQTFDQNLHKNYVLLESKGKMPDFFTSTSSQKYLEDANIVKESDATRTQKNITKDFLLKNNFVVDEILQSGKVLYNDDISLYVNKVASLILNETDLSKDEVKVLVIKTSEVNAYTTQGGFIFITLGLLAQLENEAQLAYILCHELIHLKNNHVLESHLENEILFSGKNKDYQTFGRLDLLLAKSSFSQEKEFEADREGYKMFRNTSYHLQSVEGVYDVLQYSYLPFDDIVFDTNFFNTKHIKIPSDYFLKETATIYFDDAYKDTYSSHPNIKSRKLEINKILLGEEEKGEEYLVSKDEFIKSREYARFELCNIYIQQNLYSKSIYNAYLLKQKYPENTFLDESIVKSLYAFAKYKEHYSDTLSSEKFENIQGESQQVYHLFSKLKADEVMILATIWAWNLKSNNENKFAKLISEGTLKSLVFDFGYSQTGFSKKVKDELQNNNSNPKDEKPQNKYDKIKAQIPDSLNTKPTDENFLRFAFVDLFKDKAFELTFNDQEIALNNLNKEKTKFKPKTELLAERKQNKYEKRYGKGFGVDKLVLIRPYYVIADDRKKESVKFLETEIAQKNFTSDLIKIAAKSNVETTLLDPKKFRSDDTDKYNDLVTLNEWIQEWGDINDYAQNENFINPNSERVQYLVEKYGTKYFLWTGVRCLRRKDKRTSLYICGSIIMFPLLPIAITYAALPKYSTYYYTVLFNIETGQAEFVDRIHYKTRDRRSTIKSSIYSMFSQIKSKPRQ